MRELKYIMNDLNKFLSHNSAPTKSVYVKRFDMNFEIQGITADKMNELTEQVTSINKNGTEVSNQTELVALVIATGVTFPNFKDKEVIKTFKAIDSADAVNKALLIGEITYLQEEIFSLSGYDNGKGIEEAKN